MFEIHPAVQAVIASPMVVMAGKIIWDRLPKPEKQRTTAEQKEQCDMEREKDRKEIAALRESMAVLVTKFESVEKEMARGHENFKEIHKSIEEQGKMLIEQSQMLKRLFEGL